LATALRRSTALRRCRQRLTGASAPPVAPLWRSQG